MRILLVASEVAPLAKTGGLADVSAALADHLARRGHDVRLVMPLYRRMAERPFTDVPGLERVRVELGSNEYVFGVKRTPLPGGGVDAWCIDCPGLYDRDGIYTGDDDEHRRFALLNRGALALCEQSGWAPDVAHCNDWHVGLLPLYLKLMRTWSRLFTNTRSVLTIHNIGYQGAFGAHCIQDLGLDDAAHLLHQEDLANDRISFLKTGLLYADVLTTVSRTYAREIQTEEYAMGLSDMLRARSDHLVGIVNGVDYGAWSPETDTLIPHNFSAETLDDKRLNTRALLENMGLSYDRRAPVFGIVSRLTFQKGFELLFEPLPELLAHRDARLVVLGSGEPKYEEFFESLQQRFPDKAVFYNGYSNELAHLIEAGADLFLMPSRYEPCGLNQMYSLRYGTVPIVRKTGGLADTVELFDRSRGTGTGIVFEHFDADAMRRALLYSLDLFHDEAAWRRLMLNGMAQDFSWERQSGIYEELYHRLVAH